MPRFFVQFEAVEHKRYSAIVTAEDRKDAFGKLLNGDFEVRDEEWVDAIRNSTCSKVRETFELQGTIIDEIKEEK